MKITDGTLKKLSKRLLKVVKEEWVPVDGSLYCAVKRVDIIDVGEAYYIDYTIAFGRVDGNHEFHRELKIRVGDGKHSLEFVAGQFFQMILDLDGNN